MMINWEVCHVHTTEETEWSCVWQEIMSLSSIHNNLESVAMRGCFALNYVLKYCVYTARRIWSSVSGVSGGYWISSTYIDELTTERELTWLKKSNIWLEMSQKQFECPSHHTDPKTYWKEVISHFYPAPHLSQNNRAGI